MGPLGTFVVLIVVLVLILTIVVPLVIVWLLGMIARRVSGGLSTSRYDPAAEELRIRFARGQITERQLEEGMSALGYEKRP